MKEQAQELWERISEIRIAMLTTVDEKGRLSTRPMYTQQQSYDGTLWFFTDKESSKVNDIETYGNVSLAYADPSKSNYVAVSGKAKACEDKEMIKSQWNPLLKAFFPKGLEDPTLALIEVQPDQAEYWDGPSSKVIQLAGMVKAILMKERYESGDHGELIS